MRTCWAHEHARAGALTLHLLAARLGQDRTVAVVARLPLVDRHDGSRCELVDRHSFVLDRVGAAQRSGPAACLW
ncbi:hypothetical protein ASH01_14250 [Terrabacter sp. Soil811]|nr:hypothetical protein ASH01_14250 [Terrabacter sp. Soil811]